MTMSGLRKQRKHHLIVKRLLWIVEKRYVGYLNDLRCKTLGRKQVGIVVEDLTMGNVRGYLSTVTKVNVFEYGPVADLIRIIRFSPDDADSVRLEYYRNALVALKGYASTFHDYQKHARFPSYSAVIPLDHYLQQVKVFINTKLARFDAQATYPDAVMCLSLLQFLNYSGLLNSNFDLVRVVLDLFKSAVMVLKKMSFVPRPILIYENHGVSGKDATRFELYPTLLHSDRRPTAN